MTSLAPLLEAFFTKRLISERRASPATIDSYRDSFCLLLRFTSERLGKMPSKLDIADLDAPLIGAFLEHLEVERGNSARTRNSRLAAVRSLFRYAAVRAPQDGAVIQRVLTMSGPRTIQSPVAFLTKAEVDALLAEPDQATWAGRRDYALLAIPAQTGLRLSELTGLHRADVQLGPGAHVRCTGKGRKERCTPLTTSTVAVLRAWMSERQSAPETDPLFPSNRGNQLSPDAVQRLVAKHASAATQRCLSLERKKVTPHTLRHTAAMRLLEAGVDTSVIALWLGHERTETTQIYTQTWASRNARSPGPHQLTFARDATGHQTRC